MQGVLQTSEPLWLRGAAQGAGEWAVWGAPSHARPTQCTDPATPGSAWCPQADLLGAWDAVRPYQGKTAWRRLLLHKKSIRKKIQNI